MRDLTEIDRFRLRTADVLRAYGSFGDAECGVFEIPSPTDRGALHVIASSGEGWDHVSVSRRHRCPNWPEMEQVKRLLFKDDETAMQLHVPASDHINCHPNCLHLWRPHDVQIPRPPGWMIGPQEVTAAEANTA